MKLSIAAVAGAAAVWLAGAPTTAHAGTPAWCKDSTFKPDYFDLKGLQGSDPRSVVIAFAEITCAPNDEAKSREADITKAREAWGARLGMIESDWADALAYAQKSQAERYGSWDFSAKDFAQFTPLDQYKMISDGFSRNGSPTRDIFYYADAFDTQLTEVGRLALIEGCLKSDNEVVWAVCQGDIAAWDPKKFAAQIRTDTAHDAHFRMALRFQVFGLGAQLKAHAAKVDALIKKDEGYKKLFDAAAKGRAEWTESLGNNEKAIALAKRLDSAAFSQSRKLFDGCEAETAEVLKAAISKHVPAKTFANMRDIRKDPFSGFASKAMPALAAVSAVNQAAIPYILCHKTATAATLGGAIGNTPGIRGLRTTALTHITREKVVLDDLTAQIRYPSFDDRPYRNQSSSGTSAGGAIKTVKDSGETMTVALEKLLVKREECVQSHKTNRIYAILSNGQVQYETICDKWGTVTYDETWADFQILKEYAPLLKPGVVFSSVHKSNGEGKGGEVIAIWPNKSAALPSVVLGASVK